ncbi:RNA polymerase sigma factor [Amycolatopsis benzoatilytica]|uniref:RNA polymerase sigma factor n=1 Tax=Amycolatopsis benzoatilytica TaxID=346045 RepID=UPI00037B7303|nr:sigma-70 family RNA polymerase sigma factor [Amycolatopsis benzoatilytica]
MNQRSAPGPFGSDPAAFEAFYRAHLDLVYGFVARRVSDPHLAADLTAEVFLAAIESAHTYQETRGSLTGWLFGVARNVVNAERRRAARALAVEHRISGRRLLDGAEIVRMEERIEAAATARRAYAAMDQLSEADRAVLELAALDGLSVADVAAVLNITAVAARVRLHRARRRIRDLLAPAAPGNGSAGDLEPLLTQNP